MEMLCYVRTECDPMHAAFRSVSVPVQASKNKRCMLKCSNKTFLYFTFVSSKFCYLSILMIPEKQ